ncbi:tetratricopeptide repeat-containing sulfotransferase family protein [Prochlorococcus sp. MIT 0916]|uniref:Uncharacterized protein n=1 Tax=Prochlorococcus marinus str. P0903-H212 TaxID=1622208 RepID=A0A0D5A3Z4_PROMR|nr:hypothetical protein FA03_0109 [Prochlorococcus marinus str. P0903-H212]
MNGNGKQLNKIITYTVPSSETYIEKDANIYTNNLINLSEAEIIEKALSLHSQGDIFEASKYYQLFINQGFIDVRVFSNYGVICQKRGEISKAIKLYKKSIQLFPKRSECYSNLGYIYKEQKNLEEAEKYTRKAIEINPRFANAFLNLGNIMKDKGQLIDAEKYTRKAINLNPSGAECYLNLANILIDMGKLDEAIIYIQKTIDLDPKLIKPYYILSTLPMIKNSGDWQDHIFSDRILLNKGSKDKIDIYFARANILHKKKQFDLSSQYLIMANNLKLTLYPSNLDYRLHKSRTLMKESLKKDISDSCDSEIPKSIFIVGMPRSGSTLLESILSMNPDINDLGEVNIFEDSFLEWKRLKSENRNINLDEVYLKKLNILANNSSIITNKWLYNYQYVGIILSHIPNAFVIHCFRNPLDNILSIFRAHFSKGNEYSSSLIDCAKVYLDQEKKMNIYKKQYPSKIYSLNYDFLVTNPYTEIRSLISWLGWDWNDSYESPHLNSRSVSTASRVQVRSPINSKSIGGWKNYKSLLEPIIDIFAKTDTSNIN